MIATVRAVVVLLGLFTLVTGFAYPLALTGVGQMVLPAAANGSLVERDGVTVGSRLVGQRFAGDGYFWGRPSAAGSEGYDAASSSGSNLGPTSASLVARIDAEVARLGGSSAAPVPADAATASASRLDPHNSPPIPQLQVRRVAVVRDLPEDRVRGLVQTYVKGRALGLIGEPRVNVLELNLALDLLAGG